MGMNLEKELNLGNSIFPGFNDQNGLMICGYEWGWSKADEHRGEIEFAPEGICTFADKTPLMGDRAKNFRYDNVIASWFEIWGHPLDRNGLGGGFEKSMVQTNWANTWGNNMGGDYYRLLDAEHVDNFIHHIKLLRPTLILFMGSRLAKFLNHPNVLSRFEEIMGKGGNWQIVQKSAGNATRFKVYFQKFENCQIVCLPHPSASRGLSYDYMAQFKPEMDVLLKEFKAKLS